MIRSARQRMLHFTAFVVIGAAAAACTSDRSATPETSVSATTTTTTPQRPADNRLTIGLLLPTTDVLLGQGLVDAATTAVERINDQGGVLSRPISLVTADEGATDSSAASGVAQLLGDNVDAIVGPSSSLNALSTLDDLVSARVVSCSPTASALSLDDFPDDGLFFRTIPSDSLQAVALADIAERTGVQNVAVVFVDDAYGRPFAKAVKDALDEGSRSIDAVETFGFVRSEGLDTVAEQVAASEARVVIVLAGSDDGTAFLEALSRSDFRLLTDVFVNDAIISPASQQLISTIDPALRSRIRGIAPQAQSNDPTAPFDPPGLYAANAFDCVNLIALAANLVKSDDPALFASQIPALTTGGRVCSTYSTCAELLDQGLDIDYNGPDGITELLQVGYPARARYTVYAFDDTGRAVFESSIIASSL